MAFITPVFGSSFAARQRISTSRCLSRPRLYTAIRASIETEVSQKMKEAMKAKDPATLNALRGIRAAFLTALKEEGAGDKLSDEQAITQLRKLAKMRKESISMFKEGGRDDLAEKEELELNVIEQWLPTLASEEVVEGWAKEAIEKTGASKPGDMGKVMGYVFLLFPQRRFVALNKFANHSFLAAISLSFRAS